MPDVVLNQLYRFTPLQTSFGCNIVALNGGKPELMTLIDMLRAFVAFREEVVTRRTKFLLRKARDRAHVLVGLAIAVANIDEVIALIRNAPDPPTAREQLMERRWPARDVEPLIALIDDPRHRINEDGTYNLSDEQARAILELHAAAPDRARPRRDRRRAQRDRQGDRRLSRHPASRERILTIVKDELAAIRDEFGTPRRTEIDDGGADIEDEDLIPREDMVVTVTHGGYIKRVPLSLYRAQTRGGKGRSGMATQGRGFRHPPVRRQHAHAGAVLLLARHRLQAEGLAPADRQAAGARQGRCVNMLPLDAGERITSIMPLPEDEAELGRARRDVRDARGTVRRNKLSDFVQVNRNGKIAMKLDEEGDEIVGVETCTDNDDVLLTAELGPVHPLRRRRRARLHRAAIRSACAASSWRQRPGHLDDDPRPCRCDAGRARRLSQAVGAERRAGDRRGRGDRADQRGDRRGDAICRDERYAN